MKTKGASRTVFRCQNCGDAQPKWLGQCPSCNQWNTLVEEKEAPPDRPARRLTEFSSAVTKLSDVTVEKAQRKVTGLGEFDRILGGGVWPGSMVLLGGAPGIGKSTLMMQVAGRLASRDYPVLYVSGEESLGQVKGRATRLNIVNDAVLLLSETNLENILEVVRQNQPKALVLDSIQTVYKSDLAGAPGSVGQVRECAAELLHLAKGIGITVFVLGHVTKEGDLAGPRVLEHIVDTVLYFEAERQQVHRILRAFKNRFGPTNEIGVFEMTGGGLAEVSNPSELFLGEHEAGVPAGTAVIAAMEGTRPLLVEVQSLVSRTLFGMPRRQVAGVDYNRAALLIAVLDKRCGLNLESQDVYVNVTGGLQVREPSADLGIAVAIASACLEKPAPPKTVWLGEVGLGGELRAVPQLGDRLQEAAKLGFTRAVVPRAALKGVRPPSGLELSPVVTLTEALEFVSRR
ncbi:MAG TPA: DNA repair protein RadA [Elusimicrobiota bacterium]|nr:DNA repair protein RadA [Elusimicrobiota bacterium]